jgi:hypothetical protein
MTSPPLAVAALSQFPYILKFSTIKSIEVFGPKIQHVGKVKKARNKKTEMGILRIIFKML